MKALVRIGQLTFIQGVSSFVPLLYIPLAARALGLEGWGIVAVFQVVVSLVAMIVDFGGDIAGVKFIAEKKSNKNEINEVFCGHTNLKFLVALLCVLFLISIYIVIERFFIESIYFLDFRILLFSLLTGVFQGLGGYWALIGIDKQLLAALCDTSCKIIIAILIVIFVNDGNDIWIFFLAQAVAYFLFMLISNYCFLKETKFFWTFDLIKVVKIFQNSLPVMVVKINNSLYTMLNPWLMAIFCTPSVVGGITAIERVVRMSRMMLLPIQKYFAPKFVFAKNSSIDNSHNLFLQCLAFQLVLVFSFVLVFFLFSNLIVVTLYGNQFTEFSKWLFPLSLILVFGVFTSTLGLQWSLINDKVKVFRNFVVVVSVIHVCYFLFFTKILYGGGAVLALLLTEALLAIYSIYISRNFWKEGL